jgi:hypothetical protein
MRKRTILAISAAALIAAFLAYRIMVPTDSLEWDGLVPAREVRLECVDAAGTSVDGVGIERIISDVPSRSGKDWHAVETVATQAGPVRFGIGGTGASGGERTYFWGLYKKVRRDHPIVQYRVLYNKNVQASWTEEQLLSYPPNEVIPLDQSVFGTKLDRVFTVPKGKVQVAEVHCRVK